MKVQKVLLALVWGGAAIPALAADSPGVDLTQSTVGYAALIIFALAYCAYFLAQETLRNPQLQVIYLYPK